MRSRNPGRKGIFVAVDGLDGIGKGVIERAIIEYEQKLHRPVFDAISFSRANQKGLPDLKDFWNPPETHFAAIITSDPSYAGIGQAIRSDIIALNERKYPAIVHIEAYAIDRMITMSKVVIPALKNGLRVIQSRTVASSLTYQLITAVEEGYSPEKAREIIMNQPGNKLQLEWAPDLLIIPTMSDLDKLVKRIKSRVLTQKDDNAIFEKIEFQKKLKPMYESTWLKKLFLQHGTTVRYLDAGISEEETKRQAIAIYKEFLDTCNIR